MGIWALREVDEVPLSFGLKGHNVPFLKAFNIPIPLLLNSRIDFFYKGVTKCSFTI
jgi:hypothetical protein